MPVIGTSNLPVAPKQTRWDATAAAQRVFAFCSRDPARIIPALARAFLYRASDADARTIEAYALGFCDVIDGRLQIIPKGVAACAGRRGVGSFSGDEADAGLIRARITTIYDRIRRDVSDWPASPFAAVVADASGVAFEGVIALEGVETGDGRFLEEGSLSWEELPVPLVFDRAEMDHSGATIGTINEVERREDGTIFARGTLSDSEDPDTQLLVLRAAELFEEGAVGVSISIDDVEDNIPDDPEAAWPEVVKVSSARLRSVAIVDEAAFIDARVALVATVVAAVAPARPEWFADPGFGDESDERLVWQEPERPEEDRQLGCPLTVGDDGRIFGHAALWGRCHVGYPGTCVRPPKEPAAYRGFLTGERLPGVATGPLVMRTTHASLKMHACEASAHYDHTGYACADVAVGADRYGIWVAGALRGDVTPQDIDIIRGSALSGDWRNIGGQLRLVGLLVVNAPGFRISRAMAASGAMVTVGPGCDVCEEETPLEDRVAELERVVASLRPLQATA